MVVRGWRNERKFITYGQEETSEDSETVLHFYCGGCYVSVYIC